MTITQFRAWPAVGALGLALFACGEYEDAPPQGPTASQVSNLGRVPLGSAWAYIEPASNTVFLVNGHEGVPRARPVQIGRQPLKAQRHVGRDQLLVLTQGVVGARGVKEEPAELWVLPAAATLPPITIQLDARYNDFAQSPDGRFVILFFSGSPKAGGEAAFNPNQLAVIDLASPTPVPQRRSVPSLGSVPTGIDFSPALTLPDEALLLVVVRSNNYVTLLDLAHPDRGEIGIPLTLPDDPRSLRPEQVLFDPAGPGIFIRASGSSDIYSIRLAPVPLEERVVGRHNFRPVLSQLAAGRSPSDMALFDAGEGLRLLVAGADRNVFVVDALSSRTVAVPVEHVVSTITLWSGPSPGNMVPTPQALLVSKETAKATFVDLQKLEALKTRNLEVVNVPDAAREVHPFVAAGLAVMLHANRSLTVLNLATRSVTPISSGVGIQRLRHNPVAPTLWLTTPTDRLAALNLVAGQLSVADVRLDAPADDVLVTTDEPDGRPKLLVAHAHNAGYVTVLDALAPSRENARSLRGFVASGLLERTERNAQ